MSTRWTRIERWAGRVAWFGLGVEAVLWFVLPGVPISNLLFLLGGLTVLVLGTWISVVLLVLRHRQLLGTWYGLAGLVVALALVNWGRGGATPGGITGLLLMGMLGLIAALPVSMALLLWRCDISAAIIGFALLAFLWGSLLASVPHGGPIRAWLNYLTTSETDRFWWFETLACLLMVALPLGSLAFFVHLIRLMVKEIQGE